MKNTIFSILLIGFCITTGLGQKIESQKVFGGYKYMQNGQYLTMASLAKAMEANTQSFELMQKAKSNNSIANILGFVGGGLIGWPLGAAIAGGDANWTLAGIGAGLVAVAIPISNSAHKKAREAITIFNNTSGTTYHKPFSPEFKIVGNLNGFGLSMSF